MADQSLRFRLPGAAWSLEIPSDSLSVLKKHAQCGWMKREVVGQLYALDLTKEVVVVDMVTKLPAQWSAFAGVGFDLRDAEAERERLFEQGLHCLGFWHTHPEPIPYPSGTDLQMAADHANASKSLFTGLLFLIVGKAPFPQGLGVWLHDGHQALRAAPEEL
ncbi:Mov34/MPN/PAD-1 family protein [Propionivibrio dicarboxylicus]|uniref:Mov34/MPN/PAD-1 family protein n=1 Tax=Propionivibrio dicarboxylicus TaxID=83767 RepID=UPI000B84A582